MKIEQRSEGSEDKAREMAIAELQNMGIHPDSISGREFLFRARAFGIMGVQPPRLDLPICVQNPNKR